MSRGKLLNINDSVTIYMMGEAFTPTRLPSVENIAGFSEHSPQMYATVLAKALRESRPKLFGRAIYNEAFMDAMRSAPITIGDYQQTPIRLDVGLSTNMTPTGLLSQAVRMKYGVRTRDESPIYTSAKELATALGSDIKDATVPLLFELARRFHKLSPQTIQAASALGIVTIARSTRPDNSNYTTIYFAESTSAKMLRIQLDNLPRTVAISPEFVAHIRKEIAGESIQQLLHNIPQQAQTIRIEKEGRSLSFTADNGNVWEIPRDERSEEAAEKIELGEYAQQLIAQAQDVTDEDLQRISNELGKEASELQAVPSAEAAKEMDLLREWMGQKGYEIPVNYDYKYAYLMLGSQEKADFEEWLSKKGTQSVEELAKPTVSSESTTGTDEERTEPLDIMSYVNSNALQEVGASLLIQELDSHTGIDIWGDPSTFRSDPEIAKHGGLPAFWQEHGGDFGNGVIETAGLQLVFAGLAFAFARGRVTYQTLTRLRLLAAGLSMLSVVFYEIRPFADFTNQHIMNIGQPDVLDAPAGFLGAGTPTVIDAALSKYLQLRHRRKVKRLAVGKHMGIEGIVEDVLEGFDRTKSKLKPWRSRIGRK